MIRWRYVLVSLPVFVTLACMAQGADKEKLPPPRESVENLQKHVDSCEKLRKAASLPRITVLIGFGVNSRGKFLASPVVVPEPAQLTAREKELTGDATDAERYVSLADLYFRSNQSDKGKEARRKAVPLFRKQLEQHPGDTAIQLRLADTLDVIERSEEAESLVRRLVKDHPSEWHAWLVLGRILDGKSAREIKGRKPLNSASPEALLKSMRAAKPTPEQIAAAKQYRDEAVACFDRAVSLAPGESQVYTQRGASRYHYGFLECGLRLYKGEKADFYEYSLGREALPDFRRAMELNPQEYNGIAFFYFFEIAWEAYAHHLRNPSDNEPKKAIDVLSQSARNQLLKHLEHLEKAAQDPNNKKAAEAAEVLSFLQLFLFEDYSAAEKSARRGIALDPKREIAWELLVNSLVAAENYRKLADVCRERLAYKDSARNRLKLAKAYDYLKQFDKAEEVVRVGLQREPNDFMLRLALADLLLIRGDPDSLRKAGELLVKLGEGKLSDDGIEHHWTNYAYASGICCGLFDQREKALEWLKAVQKRQPKYSRLEDALKALEE